MCAEMYIHTCTPRHTVYAEAFILNYRFHNREFIIANSSGPVPSNKLTTSHTRPLNTPNVVNQIEMCQRCKLYTGFKRLGTKKKKKKKFKVSHSH